MNIDRQNDGMKNGCTIRVTNGELKNKWTHERQDYYYVRPRLLRDCTVLYCKLLHSCQAPTKEKRKTATDECSFQYLEYILPNKNSNNSLYQPTLRALRGSLAVIVIVYSVLLRTAHGRFPAPLSGDGSGIISAHTPCWCTNEARRHRDGRSSRNLMTNRPADLSCTRYHSAVFRQARFIHPLRTRRSR